MAIINVELRMMIAERLANDNYREEIKEVKESLRLHLLAHLKENYIPKEVQTVFEKYPQFFKAVDAIYIAPTILKVICLLNGGAVLIT